MNAAKQNPMRCLLIPKVVVNMGVGESGGKLAIAETLLEGLTGQKPTRTYSKSTIKPWGTRKGAPTGCKVTLHGEKKEAFLKKAFEAVENQIKISSFDLAGNFSFGIREHIDIEGMKYDPNVGIFGMDICASVERPGYRIKRRKISQSKVSANHIVKPDESREFVSTKYKISVVEPEEEEEY
ncbi:50S ribosomal protein L5 [archaeon BMS3Abin16]|nr:50S ribosomal protein L5 [archaeon BMS3Abin16]GBE56738.1 50S ribosomal protein L5 [archaeon BMS3Bbin16]